MDFWKVDFLLLVSYVYCTIGGLQLLKYCSQKFDSGVLRSGLPFPVISVSSAYVNCFINPYWFFSVEILRLKNNEFIP